MNRAVMTDPTKEPAGAQGALATLGGEEPWKALDGGRAAADGTDAVHGLGNHSGQKDRDVAIEPAAYSHHSAAWFLSLNTLPAPGYRGGSRAVDRSDGR